MKDMDERYEMIQNPPGQTDKDKKKSKKDSKKYLQQHCCHETKNAFVGIEFGANPHGIYGASPVDMMHAHLEGMLKYTI